MAYFAIVERLRNVHKDPNSDNLYLATVCGEGVIVGPNSKEDELVLYFPSDGEIMRPFGDKFKLFRKYEDGTVQGGYLEDNGHVRAIKLRGNQSAGIVIRLETLYEVYGDLGLSVSDHVTDINGETICRKYIPKVKESNVSVSQKKGYKGKKIEAIVYPEFEMHKDTAQLAYNLHVFEPGDILNLSLKMHGTSQRSMKTYAELPRGFFRRLFHLKKKTEPRYVCGTRRTVVGGGATEGWYGTNAFREKHHKAIERYVEEGMEVFYEVVGYYGDSENSTIMPSADNTKLKDKQFVKQFGKKTVFSYGCQPGESQMYVYRITADNGNKEYTPDEIVQWCRWAGVPHVPFIETFVFTTIENLMDRINNYLADLTDPIGKTHIKEGVVVRRLSYDRWEAWKQKSYEFKVLEGLIKDTSEAPDMEEAQEEV